MQASARQIIWWVVVIVAIILVGWVLIRNVPRFMSQEPPNTQQLSDLPEEQKTYVQTLNENIRSGGPPKDGIPAIDNPRYISAAEADEWLQNDDVVFGVVDGERVRAFPQRILAWHEIVNIKRDGEPVSVSYCPLTGTAIGYTSVAPGANDPTFGVSGKLINSNLVMYDRPTDSYWPQIYGGAIRGEKTGAFLDEFPVVWTTWKRWKEKHPDTQVLSKNTGYVRNYKPGGDPYGSYLDESGYYFSERTIFPPIYRDDTFAPKTVVVGLRDAKRNAVAILKDHLREEGQVEVELGDRTVRVKYDPELDFYEARDVQTSEWINAFDAMWFAWYGFFPQTQIIQ